MSPEEVAARLRELEAAKKRKKLPEQNCVQCKKPFTPRRAWARFCSDACATYHSNNQKKIAHGLMERKVFDLEKRVAELELENESLKLQVERLK